MTPDDGNTGAGGTGSGSAGSGAAPEELPSVPIIVTEVKKASYFEGEGSEEDPYEISTVRDLEQLADLIADGDDEYNNSCYILTANIHFKSEKKNNLTPIGSERYPFAGIFDGNGYVIKGLHINQPDGVDIGLFGVVGTGAQIKNLGITDSTIYGKRNVGAIAGLNYGSIDSCFQSGDVYGRKDMLGGIAGYNYGDITRSYNSGTIGGSYEPGDQVRSGAAAKSKRWVSLSDFMESFSGQDRISGYAGGIAGYNDGTISESYQIGCIGAAHDGWGLGAAAGRNLSGGVDNFWYLEGTAWNGVHGEEDGSGIQKAELVHMIDEDCVSYMGFDEEAWSASSEEYRREGTSGGPGTATESEAAESEDTNEAGSSVSMTESGGFVYYFPQLDVFAARGQEYPTARGIYEEEVILVNDLAKTAAVYSEEGWERLFGKTEEEDKTRFLSYHITLAGDMDFSDITVSPGTMEEPYTGTLDGAGYVIYNQTAPLFGVLGNGARVENLLLEDATIKRVVLYAVKEGSEEGTVRENGSSVLRAGTGAIAAYAQGAVIENCAAQGEITVKSGSKAGEGTLKDSSAQRLYAGGLFGEIMSGTRISGSYAYMTLAADGGEHMAVEAGGMAAVIGRDSGVISSYATGFVDAKGIAGGFAARNYGEITSSYATVTMEQVGEDTAAFVSVMPEARGKDRVDMEELRRENEEQESVEQEQESIEESLRQKVLDEEEEENEESGKQEEEIGTEASGEESEPSDQPEEDHTASQDPSEQETTQPVKESDRQEEAFRAESQTTAEAAETGRKAVLEAEAADRTEHTEKADNIDTKTPDDNAGKPAEDEATEPVQGQEPETDSSQSQENSPSQEPETDSSQSQETTPSQEPETDANQSQETEPETVPSQESTGNDAPSKPSTPDIPGGETTIAPPVATPSEAIPSDATPSDTLENQAEGALRSWIAANRSINDCVYDKEISGCEDAFAYGAATSELTEMETVNLSGAWYVTGDTYPQLFTMSNHENPEYVQVSEDSASLGKTHVSLVNAWEKFVQAAAAFIGGWFAANEDEKQALEEEVGGGVFTGIASKLAEKHGDEYPASQDTTVSPSESESQAQPDIPGESVENREENPQETAGTEADETGQAENAMAPEDQAVNDPASKERPQVMTLQGSQGGKAVLAAGNPWSTEYSGTYDSTQNISGAVLLNGATFKGGTGQSAIKVTTAATLYIKGTVTITGGPAGNGDSSGVAGVGAGAGIELLPGAVLKIKPADPTAACTLNVTGGNGGNGGGGENGGNYDIPYSGTGGHGGGGGGGAGAAIGGKGGDGGSGGNRGSHVGSGNIPRDGYAYNGNSGGAGGTGNTGNTTGTVYFMGERNNMIVRLTGGSAGTGGNGGSKGTSYSDFAQGFTGGGGGGGGGGGYAAAALGTGGSGGGGGGGGGSGAACVCTQTTRKKYSISGGKGGTKGLGASNGSDGTQADGGSGGIGDGTLYRDGGGGGGGGTTPTDVPSVNYTSHCTSNMSLTITNGSGTMESNSASISTDIMDLYYSTVEFKSTCTFTENTYQTPSFKLSNAGNANKGTYNGTTTDGGGKIIYSYSNNKNAGKATLSIASDMDDYVVGSKTVDFTIDKANLPDTVKLDLATTVEYGETVTAVLSGFSELSTKASDIVSWKAYVGSTQSGNISPANTAGQTQVSVQPTDANISNKTKVEVVIKEGDNYLAKTLTSGEITITPISMSDSNTTITITNQTYTADYIKPSGTDVEVKIKGIPQTEGESYTILSNGFSQNRNAGTGAKLTIKGVDGTGISSASTYQGTFTITPKNIGDETLVLTSPPDAITYNSQVQTPAIKPVTYYTETLVADTDFTYDYDKNKDASETAPIVTLYGKGNYSGSRTLHFVIQPFELTAEHLTAPADQVYNGTSQQPKPTVAYENGAGAAETLTEGTDYTLEYPSNTTDANTACQVTVKGTGNFTGTPQTSYAIEKRPLYINPNQSKYYGQDDPELTYTKTNIVSGDTPSITGTVGRAEGETKGSYAYVLDNLTLGSDTTSQNYELAVGDGQTFLIKSYPNDQLGGAIAATSGTWNTATEWYWKDKVTVSAPEGWLISAADGVSPDGWYESITYSDGDYTINPVTYYLRRKWDAGHTTDPKAISEAQTLNGNGNGAHLLRQDTTAPAGNILIGDNVWYQVLSAVTFGTYYKESQDVTITATDYTSGIKEMAYLIDESGGALMTPDELALRTDWNRLGEKTTSHTFRLDSSKSVVYLYLLDYAGNETYIGTDGIVIDPDKPTLSARYVMEDGTRSADGVWTNGSPYITGTVADGLSGLKSRYLTWSNSVTGRLQMFETANDGSFTIRDLTDGEYYVSLSATDYAGNTVETNLTEGTLLSVKLDHSAPVIEKIEQTGGSGWQKETEVQVHLTVSDSLSGLSQWRYSVDGGVSWTADIPVEGNQKQQVLSFPVRVEDAYEDKILVTVQDQAGNTCSTEKGDIVVRLDRTSPDMPECIIEPYGQSETRGVLWYRNERPSIRLTIPAYGANEAPVSTWYNLHKKGEAGAYVKGTIPVITQEGEWILDYYAVDEAGNRSETGTKTIRWDNTAPVVTGFDLTASGNPITNLYSSIFHKDQVKVTAHVTEAGSGLTAMSCRVNGGEAVNMDVDASDNTGSFYLPVGTTGAVTVTAVDGAGNESSQTLVTDSQGGSQWMLEDTPPDIGTFTVTSGSKAGPSGIYPGTIQVTIPVADWDSGLNTITTTMTAQDQAPVIKTYGTSELTGAGGGALKKKELTFTVDSQGSSLLHIEAVDHAGNRSERSFTWILDTTAPQLKSLTVTSPEHYVAGSWTDQPVTVTLKAADSQSGILKVSYTTDGGKTSQETLYEGSPKEVELPVELEDGIYPAESIQFTVYDTSGISSTVKLETEVKQDRKIPPIADLTVRDYGTYSTGYGWYGGTEPTVGFYGPASDPAGEAPQTIYYTCYQEDQAMPQLSETAKWSQAAQTGDRFNTTLPSLGQGAHKVSWYAKDGASNQSEVKTQIIRYDSVEPVYESPSFTFEDTNGGAIAQIGNFITAGNFFKEGVRINVHVADAASGIAADGVEYSLNQMEWKTAKCDQENKAYSFELPIGTAGDLYVRTADRMGNQGVVQVLGSENGEQWVLEETLPFIGEITPDVGLGEKEWYNENITLSAPVRDEDSGLSSLVYAIDGETSVSYDRTRPEDGDDQSWANQTATEYAWSEVLTKEGRVTVSLTAADRAGNEAGKTAEFCLDKTKPHDVVMTAVDLPVDLGAGAFASQDITVKVTASDSAADEAAETSQIAGYRFSLDGGNSWSEDYSWDLESPDHNTFVIDRDGLYGSSKALTEEKTANASLRLQIWDYAGNLHETAASGSELLEIYRDTTAPVNVGCEIVSSGETPETEEGWYNGGTGPKIYLTVEDAGMYAATNHIYWNLAPESAAVPEEALWADESGFDADGAVPVPREGVWRLQYYTKDEAGNRTDTVTRVIRYDNTAPAYEETPVTYGVINQSAMAQAGNFLTFGNFFKEEVEVYLHITDTLTDVETGKEAASGIRSLSYTIADETGDETRPVEILLDQKSFTLPLGTKGRIYLYAVDEAGNKTAVMALEGTGDDNFWRVENTPPEVNGPAAGQKPGEKGWYRSNVEIRVETEDTGSGLKQAVGWITTQSGQDYSLDGSISGEDAKGTMAEPNYVATPSQAERVETYEWTDTLSMEGEDLRFTFLAEDNAKSVTTVEQTYSLDKTIPAISQITGVPEQFVNQPQPVTFIMEDGLSGIDPDSVRVLRDGTERMSVTTELIEGTRNYKGAFTMETNGTYTLQVWDAAGNPSEITAIQVDQIDTSSVEAVKVEIVPAAPDGENGWYVTRPSVRIAAPEHAGVVEVGAYYTLWKEDYVQGQPLGNPPEDLETVHYQADKEETWPRIGSDGIWHLHVWTKNALDVVTECYDGVLYVDTHKPVELTIDSEPDWWTNENPVVTVDAKPVGTELRTWCYSTDNGKNWSQWLPWEAENSFVLDSDRKPSEMTSFRVKDLAGNTETSKGLSVLRETDELELQPVLPAHWSKEAPVDTELVLKADRGMDMEFARGSISVYDSTSGQLYDTVPSQNEDQIWLSDEDKVIHVTLNKELQPGTTYYVEVSRGFANDYSLNDSREISGLGKWAFTTQGEAKNSRTASFKTEVLSGRGEQTTRTGVTPVRESAMDNRYTLVTLPAWQSEEGSRYAALRIRPAEESTGASLTAAQGQAEITEQPDGSFQVRIPAGEEAVELNLKTGPGRGEAVLTVYQAQVAVSAAGELNPSVQAEEVLGSLNLTNEISKGTVQPFGIRLEVSRGEEPEGEAWKAIEPYLPQDTVRRPLDLSLAKIKDETDGIRRESLHSLTQEIHVTLDREEEMAYCAVLRIHEGQADLIRPEVSRDKQRITFTTDRFSQFLVLYSNEELKGVEEVLEQQAGVITETLPVEAEDRSPEGVETAMVTGAGQIYKISLWIILILAAVISAYLIYKKKRREKEAREGGQEMEE